MTIVRDRYPVNRLPVELRRGLTGVKTVRLTIEPEPENIPSLSEILGRARKLRESGVIKTVTDEEAVARVRALRDEWDR